MNGSRGFLLHDALTHAMACVARGNEYVQMMQPWWLSKQPDDDSRRALDSVLSSLVRQLARQAVLLAPFMPGKAQDVWQQIGGPGVVLAQRYDQLRTLDATGWAVTKGASLFPKEARATAG